MSTLFSAERRRCWKTLWRFYTLPMVMCIALCLLLSLFLDIMFPSSEPTPLEAFLMRCYYTLGTGLYFATAASTLRRRFGIPRLAEWSIAAGGIIIGTFTAYTVYDDVCCLVMLGICIVGTCWTHNPLLQLLKVAGWFILCFCITIIFFFSALSLMALFHHDSSPAAYFFLRLPALLIPFCVAPWMFLGGLPFGEK